MVSPTEDAPVQFVMIPILSEAPAEPHIRTDEAARMLGVSMRRVQALATSGRLLAWRLKQDHVSGAPALLISLASVVARAALPPPPGRPKIIRE